jgi:hypothetical protein
VIPALFWAGVRERLLRPIVVVLLVMGSAYMLVIALVVDDPDLVDPSLVMTLVFGAGLIGRDVSSGTLALVFTRPVRRWQYVVSRWLAAAAPATVLSVVHLAVQFFVLASRGHGVPARSLLDKAVEASSGCFGLSVVLLALSAVAPGMADLGLWLAVRLGIDLTHFVGAPQWLREQLEAASLPTLQGAVVAAGGTAAWSALASYGSDLTLFLALAIWLVNRKEISYAAS